MARKLKDDEINWILDLKADGVQGEINKLSKAIYDLEQKNSSLNKTIRDTEKELGKNERAMLKLRNTGKENSKEYKELSKQNGILKSQLTEHQKQLANNTKEANKHTKSIDEKVKSMKTSDMTMAQLIRRQRELAKQLSLTSRATNPKIYDELQNKYKEVGNEIQKLKGKNRSLGATIRSTFKSKISLGAMMGNLYTKIAEFAAQSLAKVKEFVAESTKMAMAAEGIDIAFNRIADKHYLRSLRRDTKGLVNDMQLMKAAVRAENFNIPLDKLGSLLQFAQQRAKDTGESVDYLVDSIVNGIGRKSPLILDNLGISASKLNEEVKKTGDFATAVANIVEQEMGKIGESIDTTSDSVTQSKVAWENFQLALGKRFLKTSQMWSKISTSIAEGLTAVIGETKAANETYQQQIRTVAELETNIKPLAERYDVLSQKSNLSTSEQTELNTIMGTITKTVPGVVKEIDKYGNTLSINTDKVYAFIEAEKAKLQYMNRDAIKEAKEDIEDYKKEVEHWQKMKDQGGEWKAGISGSMYAPAKGYLDNSTETIDKIEKNWAYYTNLHTGAQERLKDLDGTTIENQVNAHKEQITQRSKFNSMTKKQLNEYIKLNKDAKDKYVDIAKEIYQSKFVKTTNPDTSSTKPKKTEPEIQLEKQAEYRQKILENSQTEINIEIYKHNEKLKQAGIFGKKSSELTQKQLAEKLKLEQELQDKLLQISIETEKKRYQKSKSDAGVDVADPTKLQGEKLQAYERLEQEHQANIQKIKDDSLKSQKESQERFDADILSAIQNSHKALMTTYDTEKKTRLFNLKDKLAKHLITEKEYNQEVGEVEKESLEKRLKAKEKYLQTLEALPNPTKAEKDEIKKVSAEIQTILDKQNDDKIKKEKDFEQKRQQIRQKFGLTTIKERYNAELEALVEAREKEVITEEEFERAKMQLKLKKANDYIQQSQKMIQVGSNAVKALEETQTARTKTEFTKRRSALQKQLDDGIIDREQYNKKKEKLDYEQKVKELDIQKKYADANFAMQVAQISASTAQGVVNAWASSMSLGPIVGPAAAVTLTGILLTTAGLQIAKAKAERDRVKNLTIESPSGGGSPKKGKGMGKIRMKEGFADGGYTGDGGKYEVAGHLPTGEPYHKGEYFVAQEEMQNPTVVPLVRAIESVRLRRTRKNPLPTNFQQGYADGGYANESYHQVPADRELQTPVIDKELIGRFERAINKFENTTVKAEINYWEFKKTSKEAEKVTDLSTIN